MLFGFGDVCVGDGVFVLWPWPWFEPLAGVPDPLECGLGALLVDGAESDGTGAPAGVVRASELAPGALLVAFEPEFAPLSVPVVPVFEGPGESCPCSDFGWGALMTECATFWMLSGSTPA